MTPTKRFVALGRSTRRLPPDPKDEEIVVLIPDIIFKLMFEAVQKLLLAVEVLA
jgi:hypothetical protein